MSEIERDITNKELMKEKEKFHAIKYVCQIVIAIIYFYLIWFLIPENVWVSSREYKVNHHTDVDGNKGDPLDFNAKEIYIANYWTTYNVLRGSSISFLIMSLASGIPDIIEYYRHIK